jgi:hypothetical protein
MPIFHKDTCTKWEEMSYGVDKTTIDDEVTSSMNTDWKVHVVFSVWINIYSIIVWWRTFKMNQMKDMSLSNLSCTKINLSDAL